MTSSSVPQCSVNASSRVSRASSGFGTFVIYSCQCICHTAHMWLRDSWCLQINRETERECTPCVKFMDYSDWARSPPCFFSMFVWIGVIWRVELCLILASVTSLCIQMICKSRCLWCLKHVSTCVNVFVCPQDQAVSPAWISVRVINTWASRNTQTPVLDCDGWWAVREARGSHHAQLGSGCGKGPTKTLWLLKPPWMGPSGQWTDGMQTWV